MNAFVFLSALSIGAARPAEEPFERDLIATAAGELEITFLGRGTLMFRFNGKVIHVDPVGKYADYSRLPKADLILLTHEHADHLDPQAIRRILTERTSLVLTPACAQRLPDGLLMRNGDIKHAQGLRIEALPAYNIRHMRTPGNPFHPKGSGNGYVITFGDKRVYIAGDTENIPEMAAIDDLDIAFPPMNLPYTMTPEMAAEAAKTLMPSIVYPYHFGETDTSKLVELLKDVQGLEVRVRRMQ